MVENEVTESSGEKTAMSRCMVCPVAIVLAALAVGPAAGDHVWARLDRIEPEAAERGESITLYGDFGDRRGKEVVMFPIVHGHIARARYPLRVTYWSRQNDEIVAEIPADLPRLGSFGVYVRIPGHATPGNWKGLRVLPPPPAAVAGDRGGGEVRPNRCATQAERGGSMDSDAERNAGALSARCMERIERVDTRGAYPGGRIVLEGSFLDNRDWKRVALLGYDRGFHALYLLHVESWSHRRVEVRIHEEVDPGAYWLAVVYPLGEPVRTARGTFELGSNTVSVRIVN